MGSVNRGYHDQDCIEAIEAIKKCSDVMTCIRTESEQKLFETCKKFYNIFEHRINPD